MLLFLINHCTTTTAAVATTVTAVVKKVWRSAPSTSCAESSVTLRSICPNKFRLLGKIIGFEIMIDDLTLSEATLRESHSPDLSLLSWHIYIRLVGEMYFFRRKLDRLPLWSIAEGEQLMRGCSCHVLRGAGQLYQMCYFCWTAVNHWQDANVSFFYKSVSTHKTAFAALVFGVKNNHSGLERLH